MESTMIRLDSTRLRIEYYIIMPKTGKMGTFSVLLAQKDSIRNLQFLFRFRIGIESGVIRFDSDSNGSHTTRRHSAVVADTTTR